MLLTRRTQFPQSFWVLFTGTFLNRFGGFVSVFLVLYLTSKGYTAAQAGMAAGVYGIGSLGASFLGGHLADRLGRRWTIIFSMFSSAAIMLALSQAPTLLLIILLTGLAGLTTELYRPASSALVADLVLPEQRVSAFAWYRLAVNLGFAIGSTVAGLLASRFFLLFLGDALTSFTFGLLALFALPRGEHGSTDREMEQTGLWVALRGDHRYLLFLLGSTLITFIYFQNLSTFALQVHADGLSSTVYGLLLSVNGGVIICLELPFSVITRKFPAQPAIAVGWLLIALGFGLTAVASTFPLLVITVVIWTMGEMVHAPVSAAYVANLAPRHLRGRYQGIRGLVRSAGMILGPMLGTVIFSWNAAGLWLVCGVIGLLAALLVLFSGKLPMSHSGRYGSYETLPDVELHHSQGENIE